MGETLSSFSNEKEIESSSSAHPSNCRKHTLDAADYSRRAIRSKCQGLAGAAVSWVGDIYPREAFFRTSFDISHHRKCVGMEDAVET